mgnify:FL=1
MNRDDRFVRTEESKREGAAFPIWRSFKCAGEGVWAVLVRERNMKIHVLVALAAVLLCIVLPVPAWGPPIVVVCIGIVMALECVNTAIEAVVDLVSPEWHELAKRAKDAAAGAALIAALMSVVVAAFVYLPAVVSLLGW